MFPSDGGSGAGGIPSIPGDPGTLSGAAARLGAAASAVRDWGSQLGSVTSGLSGTTWSGQGAMSFRLVRLAARSGPQFGGGRAGRRLFGPVGFRLRAGRMPGCGQAAQVQVAQAQSSATSALSLLNAQPVPAHDPAAASQRAYSEAAVQNSLQQEIGVAVAGAQAAWDQYEAAAARAAAQIGQRPPQLVASSGKIGWLNDKAGFGLVPVGVGFLAPAGPGRGSLDRDRSGDRGRPGPMASGKPGPMGRSVRGRRHFSAGVRGQESASTANMNKWPGRCSARGAIQDIAAGGITPDIRFATQLAGASRGLWPGRLSFRTWPPSSSRTTVAPPGGSTGAWPGPTGWSAPTPCSAGPGARLSVVPSGSSTFRRAGFPWPARWCLAGTALYLAGDWAYNNVKWFHDGVDDIGHGIADAGEGLVHDGEGLVHGAEDVAHFFGL